MIIVCVNNKGININLLLNRNLLRFVYSLFNQKDISWESFSNFVVSIGSEPVRITYNQSNGASR